MRKALEGGGHLAASGALQAGVVAANPGVSSEDGEKGPVILGLAGLDGLETTGDVHRGTKDASQISSLGSQVVAFTKTGVGGRGAPEDAVDADVTRAQTLSWIAWWA